MPSPSVTLLRTQSDDRLLALAAGGHERAFEAIVERYRRSLLRHARRYIPEARAEDALQQALLSAWTALRRGDDVRELRPWLHRIVHNSSLNALRAAGYDYDELRDTLEGSGGPAELAERRAVVRGTLAGLAGLPERQRDALLQIAVEGRSQDEVAQELGLSQNAVRQLVHRARTAMRAAATAVVPLPLATWLATAGAGRGDMGLRVGELVAGAGGSATIAKAGAVAALAGGAVAGPVVVHDVTDRRPPARAEAHASANTARSEVREVRDVVPTATATAAQPPAADEGGVDGSGAGGEPARPRAPGGDDNERRGRDREDTSSRSGGEDDDSSRDDDSSSRRDDDSSRSRRAGRRGRDREDSDGSSGDDERNRRGDDDDRTSDYDGHTSDDDGHSGDDERESSSHESEDRRESDEEDHSIAPAPAGGDAPAVTSPEPSAEDDGHTPYDSGSPTPDGASGSSDSASSVD
jgi:RNA polymerase sigma factor (sigma-70 family)